MSEYFRHPRRFSKNVEGAFYSIGSQSQDGTWCGDCLWCGAPEAEAPELLAELIDTNSDTYFVRQPTTQEEVEKAISTCQVCCVAALRYGGSDREIIQKLGNNPLVCDVIIDSRGELRRTVGADGELLPFAKKIVSRRDRRRPFKTKKWWQFWR